MSAPKRKRPPMPPSLRQRPRHGGLPIPFASARDRQSGRPLFGFNDQRRLHRAINQRLCGQCGQPLVGAFAFIGDEDACARRVFKEAPMHIACARYALSVCPYFTKDQHNPDRAPGGDGMLLLRFGDEQLPPAERWGIFQTKRSEPIAVPNGQVIFRAGTGIGRVIWYAHGRELVPETPR